MILSLSDLDRLISRARLYMLVGFITVGVVRHWGIGAISAVALIGLGALLRCVENYRSEPGIWMLALLFGSFYFMTALVFQIGLISDAIRGAQPRWQASLDIAVAMHCQWLAVRAMAAAAVHNRRLTSE